MSLAVHDARMFRPAMATLGSALCACITFALAGSAEAGIEPVTNTPPYSQIFVRGGPGDFVGLTNVIIIHRQFETVEVLFDVGADHDADGDLMEFHWWDNAPGNVMSTAARFTNDYAPGPYRVSAEITDHIDTVFPSVDFEVISAMQGIRMLVGDVELTGRHEQIKHLRTSIRLAEKAMERHNWGNATRRLDRFKDGLTRHLSTEVEEESRLIQRWSRAADVVQWAIKKLPRSGGPSTPSGVFPGSSSGGLVMVMILPYPASTNSVPLPSTDGSNVLAIIEARRQELLTNNSAILLSNLSQVVRIYSPSTATQPPAALTLPTSGDSGAVIIRAWADADYLNGDGRIYPDVVAPGTVIVTNFIATP